MHIKKNINLGKANIFFFIVFIFQSISFEIYSEEFPINEKFAELKILDKVSSKTSTINIKIGEELTFQNLLINVLKCQNSKFDDDPEVTAYMQVTDLKSKDNDKVFIFNGWTFASDPSLTPFDHAIYDLQLKDCNNV